MGISISIIIPVYNLEKFISECLLSLLKQTFPDFEIILIDDYSEDNSVFIIENIISKEKRIKLFKLKENHGAGYARNLGLTYAKGEYLLFLDGDDFFEETMLESLYNASVSQNADIVVENKYYLFDNKLGMDRLRDDTVGVKLDDIKSPFQLKEIRDCAFQVMHEIAWNKMFRHEFVLNTGIKFQEQHNANDQFFVFANLLEAKRIVMLSEPFVHYRINVEGQLSKSISKNTKCIYDATLKTFRFIEKNNYKKLFWKSFNSYVVKRLIFSMDKVDKGERKKLFNFYKIEGWKQLGMDKCYLEDFLDIQSYQRYLVMRNQSYDELVYEKINTDLNWDSLLFDRLIDILKKKERKSVIWGFGLRGKKLLREASKRGYNISCIVDKDIEKIGQKCGKYIIRPTSFIEKGDIILITNSLFKDEIIEELKYLNGLYTLIDVQKILENNVIFSEAIEGQIL